MPPIPEQPLYGLAAGFDAYDYQRINLEGYDPSAGGGAFQALRAYGTHSPGQVIIRGNQTVSFAGFPSVQWIQAFVDYANERWAMDTFCNGGYSGNVTVWTTTETPNVIEKWNAVLRLPALSGTQLHIPGFRDLAWTFILQEQLPDMILFDATANKTIGNSNTETTLIGTGVGSLILPASFLTAGKVLRLTAYGFISTTGTPTVTVKLKFGSTIICSSGAVTTGSGISNLVFAVDLLLTCRTVGASGTVISAGEVQIGAVNAGLYPTSGTTVVVDTTGTLAVDLTEQWGAVDPANTLTVTNFTLEKLN